MKKIDDEVIFTASFNPHKQCIKVFGDGASEIIFDADATQLATVLQSLASLSEERFLVVLKRLRKSGEKRREGQRRKQKGKAYR